jgi:uncharacterized metal-binding protein
MEQNCLDCKSKACKKSGADCFHLKNISKSVYAEEAILNTVKSSSTLVDNDRAGKLSRFQEIIEFCKLQNYKSVGLAYCFGLEDYAEMVRKKMTAAGINVIPARCTMGGVRENDIVSDKKSDAISCNPAGQARFLNERADFVVELGLCLGHDVIFHQQLKVPFTVLLVKDRVFNHAPLEGILDAEIG